MPIRLYYSFGMRNQHEIRTLFRWSSHFIIGVNFSDDFTAVILGFTWVNFITDQIALIFSLEISFYPESVTFFFAKSFLKKTIRALVWRSHTSSVSSLGSLPLALGTLVYMPLVLLEGKNLTLHFKVSKP